MQQQSKLLLFLKYGVSTGFLLLFFSIYQTEFNQLSQSDTTITTTRNIPNKEVAAEEEIFINDDQPTNWSGIITFNNGSQLQCTCPTSPPPLTTNITSFSLYSKQNISYVRHGEIQPIFVPDYLAPLQPDIFDKITAMLRYQDKDDIKTTSQEKEKEEDNNGLLITIAGYAMRYELFNWIQLVKEAGEDQFIIFCTDLKIYITLTIAGYEEYATFIPDDWLPSQDLYLFRNTELNMLDDQPARLTHVKTWVLQRLIYTMGINNILYLDVNQVMLHAKTREYITTLLKLRWDTELIASQDDTQQKTINTGLVMVRTDSKLIKRILANTIQIQETQPHLTQQEALNLAMDQLDLHLKNGNIVLLDILFFPNGHQYFEKKLTTLIGIEPYIVHVNHKIGQERKKLLQKHKFWKVNDNEMNSLSNYVNEMFKKREAKELLYKEEQIL